MTVIFPLSVALLQSGLSALIKFNFKGGVTIGNGAVIGAYSVVTKDVPPYAVVAGVPAKVIKYRFEQEKIDLLQQLQWWDWDIDRIYENLDRLRNFDPTFLKGEYDESIFIKNVKQTAG